VVEGAVDVASDSATVRVRAGQQAIEDSDRGGIVVSDTAVAAAVAWREGRLEYTLEPLSGVIADVNRYAMHRIVIGDAELNNQLFTGTVFVDRIDEWAQTLPAAFALTAVVNADGTVTLTARHTDPNPDFR
jgi:transmembrane sensor